MAMAALAMRKKAQKECNFVKCQTVVVRKSLTEDSVKSNTFFARKPFFLSGFFLNGRALW